MKEVTKDRFKEIYFSLGGGDSAGWGLGYWNQFFEDESRNAGMKYLAEEEPQTPKHTRMMITTDYGAREHRLFFMTEEAEERLFDFPG